MSWDRFLIHDGIHLNDEGKAFSIGLICKASGKFVMPQFESKNFEANFPIWEKKQSTPPIPAESFRPSTPSPSPLSIEEYIQDLFLGKLKLFIHNSNIQKYVSQRQQDTQPSVQSNVRPSTSKKVVTSQHEQIQKPKKRRRSTKARQSVFCSHFFDADSGSEPDICQSEVFIQQMQANQRKKMSRKEMKHSYVFSQLMQANQKKETSRKEMKQKKENKLKQSSEFLENEDRKGTVEECDRKCHKSENPLHFNTTEEDHEDDEQTPELIQTDDEDEETHSATKKGGNKTKANTSDDKEYDKEANQRKETSRKEMKPQTNSKRLRNKRKKLKQKAKKLKQGSEFLETEDRKGTVEECDRKCHESENPLHLNTTEEDHEDDEQTPELIETDDEDEETHSATKKGGNKTKANTSDDKEYDKVANSDFILRKPSLTSAVVTGESSTFEVHEFGCFGYSEKNPLAQERPSEHIGGGLDQHNRPKRPEEFLSSYFKDQEEKKKEKLKSKEKSEPPDLQFKCSEKDCNIICNSPLGLKNHQRSHSKNFICDECDDSFKSKVVLQRHKKGHLKQTTSRSTQNLKQESKVVKKEIPKKKLNVVEKSSNQKFICGVCIRNYRNLAVLECHWMKHESIQKTKYREDPVVRKK